MAEPVNIFTQIQRLTLQKKAVLLVVLALIVTAGMLLVTWLQKADQQLLYSNLSEEDAGAIAQKLTEMKVPYTTTAGGLMVPADRVYELRLQLSGQGLPQGGGVGYELFDKTTFTMTDFVQKLNYRRALQGELSRTVRALAEVEQCRVHLAVPEKTLFMRTEDRPKASVLVKLKTGRKLTQGQVQGIVHLVSSSVEGLDPKDISVVDTNGEMLTSAADESFAATTSQLEHQRNFERDLEARVIGILEPVVGKGKTRVRVAASLDFTRVEKTEEKFDPDSQVARSEQRNVEKSTSGGSGGVPGTASNLPGRTGQAAVSTGALSEKKNETVNYEISKTVSHIVGPSGEIKRLSIVVLVDGTYETKQGATEKKYAPRTEEELKQFEDMVKKAIGFTVDRGDEVKVVNMPFEAVPVEELGEAPKAPILPMIMAAGKYLIPLIGMALLFLFVVKPLMKAVIAAPSGGARFGEGGSVMLPQTVAELQRALERKEPSAQDQLVEWAKKNPQEAGNLVKGWLEKK